jgi:hypothetical protein
MIDRWISVGLLGAVLAVPVLSGQGKQGGTTVIEDAYLGRVGMQLIRPPEASERALEAAAGGSLPLNDGGAAFAVVSAKSWVKMILKDPYSYPENTPFLAFRQENGAFDVIRARYHAGGLEIEVAETFQIISIKIKGFRFRTAVTNHDRALEAAETLLRTTQPIRFETAGVFEKGAWGRQAQAPGPPGWPFWEDELRWWDNGEIGFITLKAAGGPTQGVISPSEGMNLHWFD